MGEITDHYTHAQPGIQRMVERLKEILLRIDADLAKHLEEQGVDLIHVAFRWINCLLVRELPLPCLLRLWDTCIAEAATSGSVAADGGGALATFVVYFCACFMALFGPKLKSMDFEEIMFFLQKLPTDDFGLQEMETLVGEAFVLKS